jgi:multidrug resistance efflux pump
MVTSAQSGVLAHVLVEPFEVVTAGQPIAVIRPFDPRTQLGLLQAEMDLVRWRLEPSLAEQNALDYERLRADWLRTQSELAVAEARLHRSQRDVLRNTPLYEEKLVSEDVYELLLKTRDTDLVEVFTKSNTVATLDRRLNTLRALGEPGAASERNSVELPLAHLTALQEAVATNLGPVTLVAPIDGVVSQIHRQPLEQIVEGEPLVTIQSPWSEYVVAYLRQPYPFDPVVGQRVLVTTRERRRREFASAISRVGAQVELITNVLAYVRQGALVDAGLPVVIPLPDGVLLRPGEIVDLRLDSTGDDESGAGALPAAPSAHVGRRQPLPPTRSP